MRILAGLLVVIAAGLVAAVLWLPASPITVDDSAAVLARVRSLRLESVRDTVAVTATARRDANALGIGGEVVTLTARGTATAGVDIRRAELRDGYLMLPAAELLSVAVDTATIAADRSYSWWSWTDPATQDAALQALTPAVRAEVCRRGILQEASTAAAEGLRAWLAEIGSPLPVVATDSRC